MEHVYPAGFLIPQTCTAALNTCVEVCAQCSYKLLRQVSIHRRSTFFLIIAEFCCADFCCFAARFGYCLYCLVVEVGRCHKSGMCHEMHLVNLITYILKYK